METEQFLQQTGAELWFRCNRCGYKAALSELKKVDHVEFGKIRLCKECLKRYVQEQGEAD